MSTFFLILCKKDNTLSLRISNAILQQFLDISIRNVLHPLAAAAHHVALQPMTALPYLFARLIEGRGLSAGMQRELAQLRERYCRIFESAGKRGEIMLCQLARVEAPERPMRRRPVADVVIATDGRPVG